MHHLGLYNNYTLTDLVYGTTYHFTVFSMDESNMAMHHVNTTYTYEKLKPIRLKDAKPTTVNLRAQNGKASFRYKVGGLFSSCGTFLIHNTKNQ